MTLNRLLITSVVIENRPVREVAAQYGVSQSWLYELVARYKAEGEAAFDPPLLRVIDLEDGATFPVRTGLAGMAT